MMVQDEISIPPRYLIENYCRAYKQVHGREPHARYMGNHWYSINGETVHRMTLYNEIESLKQQIPRPSRATPEKGVIMRLIARLRTM